jgi:kinesin family protein 15
MPHWSLVPALKVNILKEEAERQRLQREELELELHAVKDQMQNVKNTDSDMKRSNQLSKYLIGCQYVCLDYVWLLNYHLNYRYLDEKEKNLQEALTHTLLLERGIAEKDAEVMFSVAPLVQLSITLF